MGSNENLDLDGKSFSMDLWFKLSDTNDEQILLTKWNDHYVGESVALLTRGNSSVGFAFVYDDLDANLELNAEEWYYVCATFDAESLERKLYINGELLASDIASTVLINSDNGDWLIGKRSYPTEPLNFSGNIDNISIFDNVLSQSEIEDRFMQSYAHNTENILANWIFNSGDGQLLYDQSGNQNHGTIYSAIWDEEVPTNLAYISDDNFEQALVDLGYDDVLDDHVQISNIKDLTFIDLSSKEISDLTGIEHFTNLQTLYINSNQLESLNISFNTELITLRCQENQLTSLNVTNNNQLQNLYCQSNEISNLDLSQNTLLVDFEAHENFIASIDLSNNLNLESINLNHNNLAEIDVSMLSNLGLTKVGDNQLSTLDVTSNTVLYYLDCYANELSELDLTINSELTELRCQENQLSSLGLNNNTQLQNLYCQSNGIATLDLSQNTSLQNIQAHENQLTYFDLRNGVSPNSLSLNATNNPELFIIFSLEPASAIEAWTFDNGSIDEQVGFYLHFPPTTENIEIFVDEDLPLEGFLSGNDLEGGELTFSLLEEPVNGMVTDLNVETGSFIYVPSENFYGSDTFRYMVSDGTYNSNASIVSINVNPINDPPILEIADQVTDEDVPLRVLLDGTDVDGDDLFYDVDYPMIENVDVYIISDGDSLLLVPYPNWNGETNIPVYVSDEEFTEMVSFTLTVNPVDDDPYVDGYLPDVYLYEDFEDTLREDLRGIFEDVDGELTFSVAFETEGVVSGVVVGDTMLTLTSLQDANGITEMHITASNPTRASVIDTVLITVFGENDAPVIADMNPLVMTEDTPYEFMSMASLVEAGHITDVDNTLEELTFHLHSETDHVHVEWDGDANSTPMIHTEPDYYGPGSLVLCAADEYEERCTTIGLNVDPVNDAPYFASEMHAPVGV